MQIHVSITDSDGICYQVPQWSSHVPQATVTLITLKLSSSTPSLLFPSQLSASQPTRLVFDTAGFLIKNLAPPHNSPPPSDALYEAENDDITKKGRSKDEDDLLDLRMRLGMRCLPSAIIWPIKMSSM